MSDFKDNIGRNKQEGNLEYDDSAFYYFFCTFLLVILIPWTLSVLWSMVFGEGKLKLKGKSCECSSCKGKIEDRVKTHRKSWLRFGFFFKMGLLLSLWYLFYICMVEVQNTAPIKSFDPFDILEVPSDATKPQIKKAYRKMALIWHPDKRPDDPEANLKFMQIRKAYQALTDEVAMENYKKYGNPDGPSSYQVGIALPSFLLKKKN